MFIITNKFAKCFAVTLALGATILFCNDVNAKALTSNDLPRKEIGNLYKAESDKGYDVTANSMKRFNSEDPHFGWHLGKFVINGYTQETEDSGWPVFLKNNGDKVTLWYVLQQNIYFLNNNDTLTISDDTKGTDNYFQVGQIGFRRGTLMINFTNYQGTTADPIVYTDFLFGKSVNADAEVNLFEEGDYVGALDYEIQEKGMIYDSYYNYKHAFRFKIRNGDCIAFPMEIGTGNELQNYSITQTGVRLDLAKSRYLDNTVAKYEITAEPSGLLNKDVRFNRPVKESDTFTEEGMYVFTVKNKYTSVEPTIKTIYVGKNKYLKALAKNNMSVEEYNKFIQETIVNGEKFSIDEEGTITIEMPEEKKNEPEKVDDSSRNMNNN